MNIRKLAIIIGSILVALGLGIGFYVNSTQPIINQTFTTNHYIASSSSDISGYPIELTIPSLSMNLQIIPGVYNSLTQTWNVSLSKVQYATTTSQPNNVGGNTFLYGHYRPEVFAYLHTIRSGAIAIVKTANNHTFYYQLASIKTTTQYDDSVFHYVGPPILTIQTCTGAYFQYRQFYTFNLIKAS